MKKLISKRQTAGIIIVLVVVSAGIYLSLTIKRCVNQQIDGGKLSSVEPNQYKRYNAGVLTIIKGDEFIVYSTPEDQKYDNIFNYTPFDLNGLKISFKDNEEQKELQSRKVLRDILIDGKYIDRNISVIPKSPLFTSPNGENAFFIGSYKTSGDNITVINKRKREVYTTSFPLDIKKEDLSKYFKLGVDPKLLSVGEKWIDNITIEGKSCIMIYVYNNYNERDEYAITPTILWRLNIDTGMFTVVGVE